jgi:hypothetical protein
MAMPQPDDGLEGLAPVKMRPPAGIMPNAQHQTFHGFMTGAPYELAIVELARSLNRAASRRRPASPPQARVHPTDGAPPASARSPKPPRHVWKTRWHGDRQKGER